MDVKRNPDVGKEEYLLRLGDRKFLVFNTESEAIQAMVKLETIKAIIGTVQTLSLATDDGINRWQEYWDIRNTIGDFTEDDVEPIGVTLNQLNSCISFLEAFNKFIEGDLVQTPNTWRTTINQVRRIQL